MIKKTCPNQPVRTLDDSVIYSDTVEPNDNIRKFAKAESKAKRNHNCVITMFVRDIEGDHSEEYWRNGLSYGTIVPPTLNLTKKEDV